MDRNEAIKWLEAAGKYFGLLPCEFWQDNKISEALDLAIEALSAEAVQLVRCKDCRHRDLFSCPLADNDFQKDDDYCSWGERREE